MKRAVTRRWRRSSYGSKASCGDGRQEVSAEEATGNAPHVEPGRVWFARLGEVELAIVSYPIDAARLGPSPGRLPAAEHDVLERILRGEHNNVIAAARGTSIPTVKKQIGSLFRRFHVSSRAELVALIGRGR